MIIWLNVLFCVLWIVIDYVKCKGNCLKEFSVLVVIFLGFFLLIL